jgi:hypothetical protein
MERLKCLVPLPLDSQSILASHHVYLWAHNIIPNELILFIQSHVKKSVTIKHILWKFLDIFFKRIRKITWQARCNLMKQWEEQHNITKQGKKTYNKIFLQKEHQQAKKKDTTMRQTIVFDNPQSQNNYKDSFLFRPYDFTRGTKRKIHNCTPLLNNYHLTDWIFYTSSNFLHGGFWSKYISSDNNSLFLYYNSLDFFSFYNLFFFSSFSLSSFGLDNNNGFRAA